MKESLLLRQALSLCSSLAEESQRIEAAFFESVRILVMRLMNQGEGGQKRDSARAKMSRVLRSVK